MAPVYTMKLQKTDRPDGREVYSIILPVQLVRAKEWKKGDEIKTVINKEGDIVLKK